MKLAMIGFEAVAVVLMLRLLRAAGRPAAWIAVYAWHPLPLWEFAGSGHIDAAMIAFVTLALWSRRPWLTGLALAGGTLVKLYPAVLLPALWHRWDWRMPALFCIALVAAYLPFPRLPGPARTSSVSCPAMRPRKALPRAPAFIGGISATSNPAARRRLEPGLYRRRGMSARRARRSGRLPAGRSGRRYSWCRAARRRLYRAADAALRVVLLLAGRFRLYGCLAGLGLADGDEFFALPGPGLAANRMESAPASDRIRPLCAISDPGRRRIVAVPPPGAGLRRPARSPPTLPGAASRSDPGICAQSADFVELGHRFHHADNLSRVSARYGSCAGYRASAPLLHRCRATLHAVSRLSGESRPNVVRGSARAGRCWSHAVGAQQAGGAGRKFRG